MYKKHDRDLLDALKSITPPVFCSLLDRIPTGVQAMFRVWPSRWYAQKLELQSSCHGCVDQHTMEEKANPTTDRETERVEKGSNRKSTTTNSKGKRRKLKEKNNSKKAQRRSRRNEQTGVK